MPKEVTVKCTFIMFTLVSVALVALGTLLVALPSGAMADSPAPPRDYTQTTEDGRYVFVMLAPEDRLNRAKTDDAVRGKYPRSGLYLNDGSITPLWTVDWYAFSVDVSSDGQHLARWGPWPTRGNYNELALAFYENGQEMQSYSVEDLVARPETLPESVSHYTWSKEHSFDDRVDKVFLQTLTEERYVFDIKSGELVDGSLPGLLERAPSVGVAVQVLSALFGGILLSAYVAWKRLPDIRRKRVESIRR